jgi:hypothetical protein
VAGKDENLEALTAQVCVCGGGGVFLVGVSVPLCAFKATPAW